MIGIRTLSDPAPVMMECREELAMSRPWLWRLNNFLPESPGLSGLVEKEIQSFFLSNEGTASLGIVWDTFKAYIRGILISFKAHRDKLREAERVNLIEDIHVWEILNKRQVTSETTELLKRAYD